MMNDKTRARQARHPARMKQGQPSITRQQNAQQAAPGRVRSKAQTQAAPTSMNRQQNAGKTQGAPQRVRQPVSNSQARRIQKQRGR